jgi:hypothetical protein
MTVDSRSSRAACGTPSDPLDLLRREMREAQAERDANLDARLEALAVRIEERVAARIERYIEREIVERLDVLLPAIAANTAGGHAVVGVLARLAEVNGLRVDLAPSEDELQ